MIVGNIKHDIDYRSSLQMSRQSLIICDFHSRRERHGNSNSENEVKLLVLRSSLVPCGRAASHLVAAEGFDSF